MTIETIKDRVDDYDAKFDELFRKWVNKQLPCETTLDRLDNALDLFSSAHNAYLAYREYAKFLELRVLDLEYKLDNRL